MRLRIFTLFILFIFSFGFANGQCEVINGSFEEWLTTDFILPGEDGEEVSGEIMIPEGTTSVLRLLLISFSAAFDPSIALLLENEAQELIGISQSTDASEGDFAVKLQGGYDVIPADIYGVYGCTEVPDQVNVDVKHIGTTNDSLTVIVVFDEGLGELPQSEEDLEALPAYASTTLAFNADTEYETISVPVIQNFEAPIDTFYYVIIAEGSDDSYFLVDNINFETGNSGCQVTAPTITLTNEESPICICNNIDVTISLDYETEFGVQYKELILNENGEILSINILATNIHNEFCDTSDNMSSIVVAHEPGILGVEEGNNIDDLSGCFALSNEIALATYSIPNFEFNVFADGAQQEENIDICVVDDIIEVFSFSTDTEVDNIAILLVDDFTELVVVRFDDVDVTTDFMDIPPGDYVLVAISYDGVFDMEVGEDIDDLILEGCFSVSSNLYEINVLGIDDDCITDVEEVYSGNLSIRPNFSNGLFEISNPNNESYDFVVRDFMGKTVRSSNGGLDKDLIDLRGMVNGLYIVSFDIDGFVHQEKIVKI